jgi:hypothetical protein
MYSNAIGDAGVFAAFASTLALCGSLISGTYMALTML